VKTKALSPELLHKMDAYWRAAYDTSFTISVAGFSPVEMNAFSR
jgi:hypothetical protein